MSKPQAFVLALWSFGVALIGSCGTTSVACFLSLCLDQPENTVRQRLRDWYCDAAAKAGRQRRTLQVQCCFADLLRWVLAGWPAAEPRMALALDATTLGQRFTVLVVSVLYRGCAIPVAWVVLPANQPGAWKPHWLRLLQHLQASVPAHWQVLVLADRGLYARWLYRKIRRLGWHPFLRINRGGQFRLAHHRTWQPLSRVAAQVGAQWCQRVTCFKGQSVPCTLAARWDAGYAEPWLILTDLAPTQVNAYWYAWRTWIECGFKDAKRGGWQWQQTHMTAPDRASRLWLVLAVATLWTVSVGGEAEATGPRGGQETELTGPKAGEPVSADRRPRALSCFRRGRIKILASLLLTGQLLLACFWPEAWPDARPVRPVKVPPEKTYP